MSCERTFLRCDICGNLVGVLHASGVKIICCGQPMKELIPNTVDASNEKHLPACEVKGDTVEVSVGSVIHPMTEDHYIAWAYLLTAEGGQRKCFAPGDEPKASFKLVEGDKAEACFAYCNLHGLWKTDF